VSDDLVAPDALAVGRVYRDDEGLAWAVVGCDERGAARLAPPAEAPDWGGVLLEPDGGWYEADRFVEYIEGLRATAERAACRGCGAPIVAAPGTDPANHRPGCPWLTLAVRAVARGVASPSGRWLRPPRPDDLAGGR
jgi:hypothetical protein